MPRAQLANRPAGAMGAVGGLAHLRAGHLVHLAPLRAVVSDPSYTSASTLGSALIGA